MKKYSVHSAILTILSLLLFTNISWAATWIGGNGDWNVNGLFYTMWDVWDYPDAGENVWIVDTAYATYKTARYINPGYNPTLNNLYIETATTDSDKTTTLSQGQDILTVTNEYIGVNTLCKGTFDQTGGQHVVNETLTLGNSFASSGTYNLGGTGTLSVTDLLVGKEGKGDFNQSSGTITISNLLIVAAPNVINPNSVTATGTYNLSGGTVSSLNTYIGVNGSRGFFNQSGGTHTVTNSLNVSHVRANRGFYKLSDGELNVGSEIVGYGNDYGNYGEFTQTGGTHFVSGALTIGWLNNQTSLFEMLGGTLSAASIEINGKFVYKSGIITADITNNKELIIYGTATKTINGSVTNNSNGTVEVIGTRVVYTGKFSNKGEYVVSSSSNSFSDLEVLGSGFITGNSGSIFTVSNDFISSSSAANQWSTENATLVFMSGTDDLHELYVTGKDCSKQSECFTNNFSWGVVSIDVVNSIHLVDGNSLPGGALYTRTLIGAVLDGLEVTNISSTDGLNIYYDASNSANTYLSGLRFSLNGGGYLIPIIPATPGDLNADGYITIEDLLLGLLISIGNTDYVLSEDADINGDLRIGVEETLFILHELATPSN